MDRIIKKCLKKYDINIGLIVKVVFNEERKYWYIIINRKFIVVGVRITFFNV